MKKKIVFLDRDGVINKKAELEHEYINSVSSFKFNEDIFSVLKQLKQKGFEFIVISNQRGVARGLLSEDTLQDITEYMLSSFRKEGIEILHVFYCPHEKNVCDCRKPKPGLLNQACKKYEIDLNASILISDSIDDVNMGEKFGIGKNILISVNKPVLL